MLKDKHFLQAQVEIAEQNEKITEVAKKLGIVLPSTHTAIFASRYSGIETANDNGVRLSSDAVKKSLPGLIGSQVNLEHSSIVCGIILAAWIDEKANDIKIIFTMAKNIFQAEYMSALEKLAEGTLSVSFELLADKDEQEYLADGTVKLHDIDFQGVGLLIEKEPADKMARIYEFANTYKQRAKECEKDLVYASKIIASCDKVLSTYITKQELRDYSDQPTDLIEVKDMDCMCPHCKMPITYEETLYDPDMYMYHKPCLAKGKIKKPWYIKSAVWSSDNGTFSISTTNGNTSTFTFNTNNQGGVEIMTLTEEQKKLVAQLRAELEGYLPKDIKDEELLDTAKVEEFRKAKVEAEAKAKAEEEAKLQAEKQAQEKAEADKAEKAAFDEAKALIATLQATVKEKDEVIESQKKEIETLKTQVEFIKTNAETVAKRKAELSNNPYAKDFKDEDYLDEVKIEKVTLLKERDDLKAENEKLKKEPVKAEKNDEMNTGHEENQVLDARKLIQAKKSK